MVNHLGHSTISTSYQSDHKEIITKKSTPSNYLNATLFLGAMLLFPVLLTELFQIVKETYKASVLDAQDVLESRVKLKFGDQLHQLIDRVNCCAKKQLIPGLAAANEAEIQLLKDLTEQFDLTEEQLVEIGNGAHVRLEDDGQKYTEWKQMKNAFPRTSSHPADSTQYGLQGKFVKEFLFSRVTENGKTSTWFQFEKNPTRFGFLIRHMIDFFKYSRSGFNQGPYGQSIYTDKNPLILKLKKDLI